jgi:Zn-dependent peptidase ImmA (M78 family)
MVEVILVRQLGLDVQSLRDPSKPLALNPTAAIRFKTRQNLLDGTFDVAQVLGSRLGTLAALSVKTPWNPAALRGMTANSIRAEIIDARQQSWVGLQQLLDYCWSIGIPVVHLCKLPAGARKMDGMALWCEGRPVIVIACQRRQPAWQLFIVAHELGHVIRSHVGPDLVTHVDLKVGAKPKETEEREANDFAVELLTGDPNMAFTPGRSWLNAHDLAESARSLGARLKIDPGHIALNYSWQQEFIQVGSAALNELSPDANSAALYRSRYSHLDLDSLTDDNRQLFDCLTSVPD